MHIHSHSPSPDPLRRRVVGRLGEYSTLLPNRSFHRLFTRRNQLVNLAVDAYHVLTVRPTVLIEGLACHTWHRWFHWNFQVLSGVLHMA